MRSAFVWWFTALGAAMLTCYALGWTLAGAILLALLLVALVASQVYVVVLDVRGERRQGPARRRVQRYLARMRAGVARRRARGDAPSPTRGQVPAPPPRGVRAQRRLDDPPIDG